MRSFLSRGGLIPALALIAACGETGTSAPAQDMAVVDAAVQDMAPVEDAAPEPPTPDVGPDAAPPEPDLGPDAALPDAAPPDMAPDAAPVAFSAEEVQALFNDRCVGCHIGGELGGLSLTEFAVTTVRVPANESPLHRIEAGDHDRSYLWHKLNGTHERADVGGSGTQMPQGREPLPAETLQRLALFIDALPQPPDEVCDNAQDDDGDRLADCQDPGCADDAHCQPEDCANDADDNADGLSDCDDPTCAEDPHCAPEDCGDGEDNNLDSLADCDDPACAAVPACIVETCDNGVDDNADELVDCDDDDCYGVERCMVPYTVDEMQQLFNANCEGCHVGGQALGGLSLEPPFLAQTVNVPAVRLPLDRIEPGDREASFLYRKIAGTQADVGGGNRMPNLPGVTLSRLQIERVGLFIDTLPPSVEVCNNRVDDDADRLTDCADPECARDAACQLHEDCGNGFDDDDDFWVDCLDPDCRGTAACGAGEDCANNADDDADGQVDCRDADCVGDPACVQPEACAGGVDEDGDGAIDCADADCALDMLCPHGEQCGNGADDDNDGFVDCADGDCAGAVACRAELCGNGADDNGNGAIDCADADCAAVPVCQPEICDNGADDNEDGLVDCLDSDCAAQLHCQPETCDNGMDDNDDGLVDCADAACAETIICRREICNDGMDNDNDGRIDCFDEDCSIHPACIQPMTRDELQLLFDQSCGCHGGGAPSGGMGLAAPFETQTVNVASFSGGGLDRIEPGDHLASFLWLKVAGQQGAGQGARMPRGGPFLSDVDLARMALYIDQLPR